MTHEGELAGKIALITGGGSGMGRAMVRLFAEAGARVVAIARRDDALNELGSIDNVLAVPGDVTISADIDHMFGVAEQRFGRVDILCNAAGIHDNLYPLHDTDDALWDRVIATDLTAPFRICRRAIAGMVLRRQGAILNISSVAAYRGLHGPSYGAAKAGVIGMSLSIAARYAEHGIRCNVIAPGSTRTSISETSGGTLHDDGYRFIQDVAPYLFRRIGDAEDIARTALFLCSDNARHVNGVVIPVDGGFSAA